ncbi:MAG: glucosaminidase domain-containing protein [Opitutaceae bacterium]|nr:glucosaminidase domain-containing protein [Opitutaceae bacterium]
MVKESFVQKYYKHAKKAERKTGVPALFALAQSALESGWGKHSPGNMLFGMKQGSGRDYGGWDGDKQLITTTEYSKKSSLTFPFIFSGYPKRTSSGKWKYKVKAYFRAYPTPFHSFVDWSGLLSKASRYKQAMRNKDDPYLFADEVAKAGYATAPSYASKVKGVMDDIAQIIKTKGLNKKNPWKVIIPVTILALGTGLIIYGIVNHKKKNK